MSIIVNPKFANKKLATGFGKVSFDTTGSAEVPENKIEFFKSLGFTVKEPPKTIVNLPKTNEITELGITTQPEEENPVLALPENVDRMNVPQLKKVARELGIDLQGANKKDEILAILKA